MTRFRSISCAPLFLPRASCPMSCANLKKPRHCPSINYPPPSTIRGLLLNARSSSSKSKARSAATKPDFPANRWVPDLERAERVTALRHAELQEMKRYVEHTGCLMEFLARSLDDPAAGPC